METRPQTTREYFRTLRIIFYALIAGQITFGLVIFFYHRMMQADAGLQELRNIFFFIVPVFFIGGYFGGKFIFNLRMKTARSRANLTEKMDDYRSSLIVRYALLEGSSLFSIVAFLMTGEIIFLVIAAFIITLFFTMIPTPARAITDLELDLNDESRLNDPDAVISEIHTR
jgi:hypothetical protein